MRTSNRTLPVVLVLALFAFMAGSASAVVPPEAVASGAVHTVIFPVNGFQYSPADITLFVGEDVEWKGPFASHPLVSEDNLWQVVNTGDSFRFTFTQPGVYRYYCQFHGAPGGVGMSGIIRVRVAFRVYLPVVFR
jgi:plastocyanin